MIQVRSFNAIYRSSAAELFTANLRLMRERIPILPDDLTGAYTRPEWCRHGAAPALLNAASREYAARGFTRKSVDYETINPEALAFWPRDFETVAVSLVRVPEHIGTNGSQ